jgi:anthranilate phosphoribosyltransferase
MIVHGSDGLDEITLSGTTHVVELRGGVIREYEIHPSQFGIACAPVEQLRVNGLADSRENMLRVLGGESGPIADIVVLNAAAALYCADIAKDMVDGVSRARLSIKNGSARACLDKFINFTSRNVTQHTATSSMILNSAHGRT